MNVKSLLKPYKCIMQYQAKKSNEKSIKIHEKSL